MTQLTIPDILRNSNHDIALRVCDRQLESDLVSIRKSCDFFHPHRRNQYNIFWNIKVMNMLKIRISSKFLYCLKTTFSYYSKFATTFLRRLWNFQFVWVYRAVWKHLLADLRFVKKFTRPEFSAKKVRKLRRFLLKKKQRKCINISYFSSFFVRI